MKKIYVKGKPPYKQAPASVSEKKRQLKRAGALKTEAGKVFENPTKGRVRLTIQHHRNMGRSDAANIIGGIADALEKIAYDKDRQIVEIVYRESLGEVDEYWIEVQDVDDRLI